MRVSWVALCDQLPPIGEQVWIASTDGHSWYLWGICSRKPDQSMIQVRDWIYGDYWFKEEFRTKTDHWRPTHWAKIDWPEL